jgi:hypothetical protein
MERLNLNSISDIVYRLRRGQSERAIAKDVGHSRNTVRHYHNIAREKGYLDLGRGVPEPDELLRELGPARSSGSVGWEGLDAFNDKREVVRRVQPVLLRRPNKAVDATNRQG